MKGLYLAIAFLDLVFFFYGAYYYGKYMFFDMSDKIREKALIYIVLSILLGCFRKFLSPYIE